MSRRRRPGRPRGSTSKTSRINEGLSPDFDSQTLKEVVAIGLFVFAFFIFLSLFGLSGSLGLGLYSRLRVMIGWTVFIVPFISAFLGYMLFYPERYEFTKRTYLGIILFLASFSGMFHVFTTTEGSFNLAKEGVRGGLLGYFLQANLLKLFNAPLSFIIFFALGLVAFILTANRSLRSIFDRIKDEEGKPKEEIKINEPAAKIEISQQKVAPKFKDEMEIIETRDDSGWKFPPIELFETMT